MTRKFSRFQVMPSAERKTDKKPEWAKKLHIFSVSCPCNIKDNMKWISLKCRESSREKILAKTSSQAITRNTISSLIIRLS